MFNVKPSSARRTSEASRSTTGRSTRTSPGGRRTGPGLRRSLERIDRRETDGVACWRLKLFARNVGAAIVDIERIHAAGAHVAFVEET